MSAFEKVKHKMEGKNILCPISASFCTNGQLILPQDFCTKFSNEIPETVYLGVRNGEAWRAYYRHGCGTIVNLGAMMTFYRIKPYNIILLGYKGDGNFNMEIFNDNVEIEYPLHFFGVKKQRLPIGTWPMTDLGRGSFTDFEMEKMAAKFFYNASRDSRMSYDLTIETEHLQLSNFVKELPRQFTEAYSGNLSKELYLIIADGSIYHAHFCEMENLLYGLKGLFVKLGLGEGFYLFFDYVGPSYLYLSIYTPSCLDIFNCYSNKKSLKDIRKDYMVLGNDIYDSTDESSDDLVASSYAGNPGLEMTIRSHEPLSDSASALMVQSSNDIALRLEGYNRFA